MSPNQAIKNFVVKALVLFTVLGALCTFLFVFIFPSYYTPIIPVIFGYFFFLNIVVFRALVKIQLLSFAKFSRNFMVLTLVKLFVSFTVFIVIIYFNKPNIIPIVGVFFTLYTASLVLEVVEANKYMRKITKK